MPGRVTLDLERLHAGDVLGSEITGPLEVAAFLDGFDITDSAEFTHWKDRQQARLLPVIKDALLYSSTAVGATENRARSSSSLTGCSPSTI